MRFFTALSTAAGFEEITEDVGGASGGGETAATKCGGPAAGGAGSTLVAVFVVAFLAMR